MANFTILETKFPKNVTVSYAAGIITQPRGGYIQFKDFQEEIFEDEEMIDGSNENISAALVGLTVDYLTRYLLSKDKEKAFDISYKGYSILDKYVTFMNKQIDKINKLGLGQDPKYTINSSYEEIASTDWTKVYDKLMSRLDLELSDLCISSAAKLSGFDVAYRRGPQFFTGIRNINPDPTTIEHIRKLTQRTLAIIKSYGELIDSGFDFPKAYTKQIVNGDADYLTEDTLWDLKVIKGRFNKAHTIQLLLYWRLGMKSDPEKYSKVKYIGIISPRHNKAYRYNVSQIPQEFIDFLDYKAIGYKQNQN